MPHNNRLMNREKPMSRPPMVGVPALLSWALTSSRIYWPHLTLLSQAIKRGPTIMDTDRAVSRAQTERKVIYRKTLNPETSELKYVNI